MTIETQDNWLSGEEVKKLINSGTYLPDDLLMEVFREHLLKLDRTRGIIIDGVPRTLNQAELLAKKLAFKLGLKFVPALIKIRETQPQAEIKEQKERLKNIKNAFKVSEDFKRPATIIVVDDIITTGATMNEAARVLKKAGVKKVIGVAVARG